jgi:hypothetical protein
VGWQLPGSAFAATYDCDWAQSRSAAELAIWGIRPFSPTADVARVSVGWIVLKKSEIDR